MSYFSRFQINLVGFIKEIGRKKFLSGNTDQKDSWKF